MHLEWRLWKRKANQDRQCPDSARHHWQDHWTGWSCLHKLGTTNYHVVIALHTEAYKHGDLATEKQVAIPVIILDHVYLVTRWSINHRLKAINELVLIAFYFLLRKGEYTYYGEGLWQSQQFGLCNMKVFAAGIQVWPEDLHHWRDTINLVSLTIDNQKNVKRCQTLSYC